LEDNKKEENSFITLNSKLIELLTKFTEIELEDVELNIGDLELCVHPHTIISQPNSPTAPIKENSKPTKLMKTDFKIPKGEYPGEIIEVKLGATKKEGGSRGASLVIGGERAPAFYLFDNPMVHSPIISFDIFDIAPPLAKAMKAPFVDVLNDPVEWAKRCVNKFGADMLQLHLTSIDPLLANTSPQDAAKTVENVLQAVDVPLAIGGCGDPQKDFLVFKKVAEVAKGERLLINSITLDMDIKKMAEIIRENGHVVIAFTTMDLSMTRELNRKLYDYLPKENILNDTTTAALGYGLEYAFSVMERTRLSGLMGDPELQHPLASGTTNAWAAREAWMKMDPKWGPRELRGPIWETVTALILLLAGVDFFMMMHPVAVKVVKDVIKELKDVKKANPEKISDWVTTKI